MICDSAVIMKMKGVTSSIFKKCLQDSGFEVRFDTIVEADDEEREEGDTKTVHAGDPGEQPVRPVSPKRSKRVKFARKISVPCEIPLLKCPRKQCEIRHVNSNLNRQLNQLLRRTSSLQEELNRGRQAMEKTLESKKKLETTESNEPAKTCTKSSIHATFLGTSNPTAKLINRERRANPSIIYKPDVMAGKISKKEEGMSAGTVSVTEIRKVQSPRPIFANKTRADVGGGKNSTNPGVSKLRLSRESLSLPNLNVVHVSGKPRSHSFQEGSPRLETGKTTHGDRASQNRKNMVALPPPQKSLTNRNSPRNSLYGDESIESTEAKSTQSPKITHTVNERSFGKNSQRQCYKTQAGEMVKMANLMSMATSQQRPEHPDVDVDETWRQIQHCRYLRNHTTPDFCTCNQCERCRRE